MKKILLAACMLFCISGAYAQIKVGAKAGLNLATLTDFTDTKLKVGFHAGGFVEIPINASLGIQPELLYSAQGTSSDGGQSASFNYLNLPVMLKIGIIENLSVEVGPQVGYLLSAELEESDGRTADVIKQCNRIDFSAVAGASYVFAEKFVAGLRFGIGLTAWAKSSELDKSKNYVMSLSLGYKF